MSAGAAQTAGGPAEPGNAGAGLGAAPSEGGVPNEAGAPSAGGTPQEGGAGGSAGGAGGEQAGAGGADGERPPVEVLLGDYDVYMAAPPAVAGCSVAWYEPRINLAVSPKGSGKLEVLPFADFFWQANFAKEPAFAATTLAIAALLDWEDKPLTPALKLGLDSAGFDGTGWAEIPYTCTGNAQTTRTVSVTLEPDRTSPTLRVDAGNPPSFGFTKFSFTFSEPVQLPSGNYGITFSEPTDGENTLELYDVDTNTALATAWKWALGGPVAQARFLDPASAEGRTVAARLTTPLNDRAGNALVTLDQDVDIEHSAVLETALDFDVQPTVGLFGNASYHAAAGPGAECEQGGCLVLEGTEVACYGAPLGGVAVRLPSTWESLELRYRVWSSTVGLSPLEIGYASGCTGYFPTTLVKLAQPDGAFTHASAWTTANVAPCGGPDYENGFTVALGCAESGPLPVVRVVIERIARPASP